MVSRSSKCWKWRECSVKAGRIINYANNLPRSGIGNVCSQPLMRVDKPKNRPSLMCIQCRWKTALSPFPGLWKAKNRREIVPFPVHEHICTRGRHITKQLNRRVKKAVPNIGYIFHSRIYHWGANKYTIIAHGSLACRRRKKCQLRREPRRLESMARNEGEKAIE